MQQFYKLSLLSSLFFLLWPIISSAQLVFDQEFDLPVSSGGAKFEMPWIGGLNSAIYNRIDLDGDGTDELVLYDRSGHFFQIFRREGGSFQAANELCVLLPELEPGWILFVDFDLDGKKDLFAYGERGVVVYRNTATGWRDSHMAKKSRSTAYHWIFRKDQLDCKCCRCAGNHRYRW